MRRVRLLVLIVILLLLVTCAPAEDVPAYTADQVLQVAKDFSPNCRVRKSDKGAGTDDDQEASQSFRDSET